MLSDRAMIEAWLVRAAGHQHTDVCYCSVREPLVRTALAIIDAEHRETDLQRHGWDPYTGGSAGWQRCTCHRDEQPCSKKLEHEAKLWRSINGGSDAG